MRSITPDVAFEALLRSTQAMAQDVNLALDEQQRQQAYRCEQERRSLLMGNSRWMLPPVASSDQQTQKRKRDEACDDLELLINVCMDHGDGISVVEPTRANESFSMGSVHPTQQTAAHAGASLPPQQPAAYQNYHQPDAPQPTPGAYSRPLLPYPVGW